MEKTWNDATLGNMRVPTFQPKFIQKFPANNNILSMQTYILSKITPKLLQAFAAPTYE